MLGKDICIFVSICYNQHLGISSKHLSLFILKGTFLAMLSRMGLERTAAHKTPPPGNFLPNMISDMFTTHGLSGTSRRLKKVLRSHMASYFPSLARSKHLSLASLGILNFKNVIVLDKQRKCGPYIQ